MLARLPVDVRDKVHGEIALSAYGLRAWVTITGSRSDPPIPTLTMIFRCPGAAVQKSKGQTSAPKKPSALLVRLLTLLLAFSLSPACKYNTIQMASQRPAEEAWNEVSNRDSASSVYSSGEGGNAENALINGVGALIGLINSATKALNAYQWFDRFDKRSDKSLERTTRRRHEEIR